MYFLQFYLFFFSLLLSLIRHVYPASRMYTQGTKYENTEYLNFFKVPMDSISSVESSDNIPSNVLRAFDDISTNYWISQKIGTKYTNTTTGKTSTISNINITITFKKTVFIKSMIYQAWSVANNLGVGYPEELSVYYLGNDEKYILADNTKSTSTDKKVIFTFLKIIESNKIVLEWKKIHNTTSYINRATAKEITFLYPEGNYINSTILNLFDKNDYKELSLSPGFNDFDNFKNMLRDFSSYHYNDYMKEHINRILAILHNIVSYDPKREFSTIADSDSVRIFQRGDIEEYARSILKMDYAGTNRQSMGIYGRAKEKITVYVKASKSTDPLPKIQFTQYVGDSGNWLGKTYDLRIGKQILTVDDFKLKDNLLKPTFPGGPLYLINPYTSTQQGQVSIYVEGGIVFPTFRIGWDIEKYKEELQKCIELNKKNNKTYFDITELYGINTMITVKASDAYRIYSNKNNISPLTNLRNWDSFLKTILTYDGVQFSSTSPYYNKMNRYINIHYRYSQPHGEAYASTQHIGVFYDGWIEHTLKLDISKIGWGFVHEIGHMIDIAERKYAEITNNMMSKHYDVLIGDNTMGIEGVKHIDNKIKYLTQNNINNKIRGCELVNNKNCRGFLKNSMNNFFIWWDLESINHGYWSKLENLYRYNDSLPSGLSKEEKMVYFSSIIFKLDLGYYFTRWGLSLGGSINIFDESNTTSTFKNLMKTAKTQGLIDTKAIKKKFWYLDNQQYTLNNEVKGCYSDQTKYNIQIVKIIKQENKYEIILPNTGCIYHLGFEIYESDKLIGFTHDYIYTDETQYNNNYTPNYKIIAYDRQLYYSKESEYKNATSKVSLKFMNFNQYLKE